MTTDLITLTVRAVYNTKRTHLRLQGCPDDIAHEEAGDAAIALQEHIDAGVWVPVEFVAKVEEKSTVEVQGERYEQRRLM